MDCILVLAWHRFTSHDVRVGKERVELGVED